MTNYKVYLKGNVKPIGIFSTKKEAEKQKNKLNKTVGTTKFFVKKTPGLRQPSFAEAERELIRRRKISKSLKAYHKRKKNRFRALNRDERDPTDIVMEEWF